MAEVPDPLGRRWRRFGGALAAAVYAFLIVPSLIVIPISFGGEGAASFPPRQFSLSLYATLFRSQDWMAAMGQSLLVAFLTTAVTLPIGVPASYALQRFRFPGKALVTMLLMSPAYVPVIVVALGFYLYFSVLRLTGTTLGLVAAHAAYVLPFVLVTVGAGVRQLDPALEFAARLMGAGRLVLFRSVVLPQLAPSILAGALFAFLISFDEVVLAWFVTSASTMTLPVKMYSSIQWDISPTIAAVSTLLTTLSCVVCGVAARLQPATVRELKPL